MRMKVRDSHLSPVHHSLELKIPVQWDVYLSIAFLPHLAVGLHAEITVTHSGLHHLHFCCKEGLCLSTVNIQNPFVHIKSISKHLSAH